MISSVICLFGEQVAGSAGAPGVHSAVLSASAGLPLRPMDRGCSGRSRLDALRLAIKQDEDCQFWLYQARRLLPIQFDGAKSAQLVTQIYPATRGRMETENVQPRRPLNVMLAVGPWSGAWPLAEEG